MATKEKFGSVKRFGARYGRKTKEKFGKIEKEQRKLHKCPYCNNIKVKREAVGIWNCKKCKSRFAGRAYSISKKAIIKEDTKKEELEEKKEQVKE